jgi:Cyclin
MAIVSPPSPSIGEAKIQTPQALEPSPRLVSSRQAVVALLAARLSHAADARDLAARTGRPAAYDALTTFHALEAPAITIADYVARVAKYAYCSNAALVSAYLYMERAAARNPCLGVSGLSCHRLFMTSVVLAAKFHDDVSYNLDYYGKVGGLPVPELAALEVTMLKTLDYRLSVDVDEFAAFEVRLLSDLHALVPPAAPSASCPLVAIAVAECAHAGLTPPADSAVDIYDSGLPVQCRAKSQHAALLRVASSVSFISAVTSEDSTSNASSNCTSPHVQNSGTCEWDEDRQYA